MNARDKKVISHFLILFVIGWGISLATGNIIITILGCFVIGLALNKNKIGILNKGTTKSQIKSNEIYCGRCGVIQKSGFKFCSSCGSKLIQHIDIKPIGNGQIFYPNVIIEKLRNLKNSFEEGELDAQSYYWLFSDIIILDENGILWSIGADSLNWYRIHQGEWINDTPSGKLQIFRKSDKYLI